MEGLPGHVAIYLIADPESGEFLPVGRWKLETYNQEQFTTRMNNMFKVTSYSAVSGHDFRSWRDLLADFAPRIFSDE
jgi:hypothetical protein